jgi:aspartate/glutamate racemase
VKLIGLLGGMSWESSIAYEQPEGLETFLIR